MSVLLLHGGPGVLGEMQPVREYLEADFIVQEPICKALSIAGQVQEVVDCMPKEPSILVGYSWGAWLALIIAAKHTMRVCKVILVSSGPFDVKYVLQLHETRRRRLGDLPLPTDAIALAKLHSKTDDYDPLPSPPINFDPEIYNKIWPEAAALRESGELLKIANEVQCPIVAIHGDYDPHPFAGVQEPLGKKLKAFHLLPKCGHTPWLERHACERFFSVLKTELQNQ